MSWATQDFIRFLVSQFVALTGDRIATLAIVSLAGAAGGAAASAVAAIQIIPLIMLAYPAGAASDIVRRSRILAAIGGLRAVAIVVFLLLPVSDGVFHVYILVFVLGCLAAFFNTAKRSFIPFLVQPVVITEANWYLLVSDVAATGIGIAIGSMLLTVLSPGSVLIFDAAAFAIAGLIALRIGQPEQIGALALSEHFRGLRVGWRVAQDLLRQVPALGAVLWTVTLPYYMAAGCFYAAANHWAVAREPANAGAVLGPTLMALAAGALISFPIRGYLQRLGLIGSVAAAFAVGGALMIVLGAVSDAAQWVVLSLVGVIGVTVGAVYPSTVYLLHLVVPRVEIGKAIGMNEVVGSVAFAGTIAVTVVIGAAFTPTVGWSAGRSFFWSWSFGVDLTTACFYMG